MLNRRDSFDLSPKTTYLNGNSLGPLTHASREAVQRTVTEEWGHDLIRAWNTAGWFDQPGRVGDMLAPLIGAAPGSVMVGDTLTLKLRQALAAALAMSRGGKRILSDTGNFPSDLYIAAEVGKVVTVAPDEVLERLNPDIDVLMLTEVDYRTGRRHDMATLTKTAQELGIICVWDLAHSAGAVAVDLAGCGAEFAVGCTYKYLNGGPGAPAFIYARPDLIDSISPDLVGWMGHESPFAFDLDYRPGQGRERWRIGTPPVLQMAAIEGALGLWEGIDMSAVEREGRALGQRLIDQLAEKCPQLESLSPETRGSHVAFAHDQAYALMQVLIAQDIIGDFRAPNMIRFGFSPLYNDTRDVEVVVDALEEAFETHAYERPEFQKRARVT